MTPAEYRQLIRTVRNGPCQLGIRIDGNLREVYEFASKSDRERFILSITPPRPGQEFETLDAISAMRQLCSATLSCRPFDV